MNTVQREAKNKYMRGWCARNREKVRKTNKESFKRRYVPHPRVLLTTSYYERHGDKCRDANKKRRDALRALRISFVDWIRKNCPCSDCGVQDWRILQFDHVPERGTRLFGVSDGRCTGASERVFFAELSKCDVVCANCHSIRTRGRGQW